MFNELLKFEVQFHVRNKLFWVAALAFLYFGFAFSAYGLQIPYVYTNSPFLITYVLAMLSMGGVFVLTIFCANAVLRDKEHYFSEIICTTPVSKFTFLGSRFGGALLAGLMVFSFAAVGILISIFLPGTDPEKVGPFRLSYFLWPLCTLALPNLLFSGALIFLVATHTQSRMSTYLAGLFIYILYVVGSLYASAPWLANATPATPEAMALAARLDPFGISAFFEQTRYWTTAEQNTKLLAPEGNFLINRLLWTAFSLLLLSITYRFYSFKIKAAAAKTKSEIGERTTLTVKYKPVATNPQITSLKWLVLREMTTIEMGLLLKNRVFLVVLVLWTFLIGTELWSLTEAGLRMSPDYPTTGKIITKVLQVVHLFGIAVLIFYSNEQVWRNRQLKADEMLDASPVSNLIFYTSKYVALTIIPLALVTVSILVALLLQVSNNYFKFEPGLYLLLYFYACTPLWLIAVLALCVQTLAPNKYVGMLLTSILVLGTGSGLSSLAGIEHVLFRFAAPLTTPFSDMNGFGDYAQAFNWRMLYWGAAGSLLMVLTYSLWERGKRNALQYRFRSIKQLSGNSIKLVLICLIVFMGCGSFIFYHTNIAHTYTTNDAQEQWSKMYEVKYKPLTNLPQPTIIAVSSKVDLFQEQQQYKVTGQYVIYNNTKEPLTQAWVGIHQDSELQKISITGARLEKEDKKYGMYLFKFEKPLKPGKYATANFKFSHSWSGLSGHSPHNAIVKNGSFMRISRYFPFFGYEPDFELENPDTRRELGLPEAESAYLSLNAPKKIAPYVKFEAVISTSPDQTAITSGYLVKEWKTKGRRYFHYKADKPMPFRFAVASARYQIAKTDFNGIAIEVYHHPEHKQNVKAILETVKKTLAYCTEQFGPYPSKYFRLAEVSLFTGGFAATSYPNTIFSLENRGFVSDLSNPKQLHYLYQLIAHEVSHQWWGGQLDPDYREGADMLTETLSQYTEMLLLEKMWEKQKVHRAMSVEHELYFSARGQEPEKPLFKVVDQPYVSYHKGSVIMYALKERIGEKQVNLALKRLLQSYGHPSPPPTALDLLNELKKVSPVALHKQLDEWFKKVIVYDLKIQEGSSKKLPDGRYLVNLKISGEKLEDILGKEVNVALTDEVEIAIYGDKSNRLMGQQMPLYLKRYFLNKKNNVIPVVVSGRPHEAVIDPYLYLLDKNRDNNSSSFMDAH